MAEVVALAVAAVVAGVAIAGWFLSEQLRKLALLPGEYLNSYDLVIEEIGDDRCTLGLAPSARRGSPLIHEGLWGLEWEGGYGQIGRWLEHAGRRVTCEFFPRSHLPRAGDLARVDFFTFPKDPVEAFGIPFQEVTFTSRLGEFPAWHIPGGRDTWVVMVHGRGAPLQECLRVLPEFNELGFPVLAITYRNDPGVPASPDGFHRFGETEWADLESGVEYALGQGARSVVLMGYSMGGGIVVNFMFQSLLKERVRGLVLDSPMLDLNLIVRNGSRQFGPLHLLTPVGKLVSSLRFGLDWNALDYVRQAGRLKVPVLLFHGRDDGITPIETSERLLSLRPDLVTLVSFEGAIHACGWNKDPEGYGERLRRFLTSVVD